MAQNEYGRGARSFDGEKLLYTPASLLVNVRGHAQLLGQFGQWIGGANVSVRLRVWCEWTPVRASGESLSQLAM
jgi:hypothetical protein